MTDFEIVPVTFRQAAAYVAEHHRHHKPPRGMKFAIGLASGGKLVGVIMAGRPVARLADDGRTVEINRSCTDGTPNANSALYGAAWRCAKAMGYRRAITYTLASEGGASLRGAGWVHVRENTPHKGWSREDRERDGHSHDGDVKTLWEIKLAGETKPWKLPAYPAKLQAAPAGLTDVLDLFADLG